MGKPNFEHFGKYVLLEKLASGGMAEVFLAKRMGASGVQKFVAIKRILPQFSDSEEFVQMFKDEAKIAVNLSHSNVISIHDFGVEHEMFYLVMEYCEGRNLRQILNKMKKSNLTFSVSQSVYMVKEVAAGLDHAHRCLDGSTGKPLNITHRDMSPQNVMISFEGETKIVDFGIAKASTQIETTRAGTLKGKFGYMSPEQAEGLPVDFRTDIFSLGICLWELLANDRLFVANNEINTLRKIRECNIPSLRKINPNIPPELEKICNKSLAKDRNLRYQSAAAFHRDLNRFLNRHDPDFSPHDFSVFIKTLFANEILETRKKVVQYAQYQPDEELTESPLPRKQRKPNNNNINNDDYFPEESGIQSDFNSMFDEKSSAKNTNTMGPEGMTSTENSGPLNLQTQNNNFDGNEPPNADNKVGTITDLENQRQIAQMNNMDNNVFDMPQQNDNDQLQGLENVPPSDQVSPNGMNPNLPNQQQNDGSGSSNPNYNNAYGNANGIQFKNTGTNITYGSYTNTSYHHGGNKFMSTTFFIVVAVVGFLGYSFYKSDPERAIEMARNTCIDLSLPFNCSKLSPGNFSPTEGGERGQVDLASNGIFVRSKPPGAEIIVDEKSYGVTPAMIPKKTNFSITLKKNGFFPFTQYYDKIPENGITAELIKTKVGYLKITVIGQGEVFVDGQKIRDTRKRVAVQANKDILVEAVHPVTKNVQKKSIRVGADKEKQVVLAPF